MRLLCFSFIYIYVYIVLKVVSNRFEDTGYEHGIRMDIIG